MPTKFMAIGKDNMTGPACDTPRAAAQAFFERYPMKRLCSVTEGEDRHPLWLRPIAGKHRVWRNITKAQIDAVLPDIAA